MYSGKTFFPRFFSNFSEFNFHNMQTPEKFSVYVRGLVLARATHWAESTACSPPVP